MKIALQPKQFRKVTGDIDILMTLGMDDLPSKDEVFRVVETRWGRAATLLDGVEACAGVHLQHDRRQCAYADRAGRARLKE